MYLAIIILPLLGSIVSGFFGRKVGVSGAQLITCSSVIVTTILAILAAVIFVFFFLAEYASIVLICILTSILYLGGYIFNFTPLIYLIQYINFDFWLYLTEYSIINGGFLFDPLIEGILDGLSLGLKACALIFVFIWARASFPRIRFDQLMSFCWTILLPLVIAFIILVPCVLYSFDIIPSNISLF